MGDRFLVPSAGGGNWIDATSDIWSGSSGGAADGGIAATDDAKIDANSTNLTLANGAALACGSIDTTGCASNIGGGDGTTVTVNGSGGTGADILIVDSGAWSPTATFAQAASGDLVNADPGRSSLRLSIGAAGFTTTLTGSVYSKKLTLGAGTVTGAQTLFYDVTNSNYWSQDAAGTLSVATLTFLGAGGNTIGAVDFSAVTNGLTLLGSTADRAFQLLANWAGGAKDLTIYSDTDTKYMKLLTMLSSLSCRKILLGSTGGSEGGGQIGFGSGNHAFTDMNIQAGGDAAEDLVDFETCNIVLAGTIDCTGIDTLQNAGAVVNGGTVDNTDLTGQAALAHIFPAAGGTGNTNVNEFDLPPANQLGGRTMRHVRGR